MSPEIATFLLLFGVGLFGLFWVWRRATPELAERLAPYWTILGPIWYLPVPIARAVWSLVFVSSCGFAFVVLLGHVL
jgi:hypothetical protein